MLTEIKPRELRQESAHWIAANGMLPTTTEVLVGALLVAGCGRAAAQVRGWARVTSKHASDVLSKGTDWKLPGDWVPGRNQPMPEALEMMEYAFSKRVWTAPEYDQIAAAVQAYEGPEARDDLDGMRLKNYLCTRKPLAPKHDPKRPPHPRWRSGAAALVAAFVHSNWPALRAALGDGESVPREEMETLAEAQAARRVLETELATVEASERRLKDHNRKLVKRRDNEKADRKAKQKKKAQQDKLFKQAMTKRLNEMKAAAKAAKQKRIAEVREQLRPAALDAARGAVRGELSRSKTWRNRANENARCAKKKLSMEVELSGKRLKRAEEAEEKLGTARDKLAEYGEHYSAALAAKKKFEAIGKRIQQMPTWRPVVRGKGQASFDTDYRIAIYSQHANGTPLSAIGQNIVDVVRRTAPWLEPVEPSRRVLVDTRFEMRTIVEAMGGRDAAAAHRIRMLGSDESSKYGNAAITSNLIVEKTPDADPEVVILRGVYISAGGTAQAVANAIENKCFARLRDLLRRWEKQFKKMYPGEPWTGPDPKQLSLGRLAGGGALMADNCNTAQATENILAEMIAEQAKEFIEGFDSMDEKQKAHATRVYKLNCWNHLRNIFLKPMSKAQADHVAEELKDHLDAFSSWDRMTTDFTQLLRACYKEFHASNTYYKGKGREFWAWVRENYPKVFILAIVRAEGGRQDLDYDASIPMYMMRPYLVEFLHTLVFTADHANILEDFLYCSFSSLQFIAMTRANAVIDFLIVLPMRWLSGNSYKLDNWSPMSMRFVLRLVYDVLVKASTDGSILLDTSLDIFKSIADTQPLFQEWRDHLMEKSCVCSADRSTYHLSYKLAHDEIFNPAEASNKKSRLKTIEYLEKQAAAAVLKIEDPKIALARNLPASDEMGVGADALAHADTMGLDATNDRLAESLFGHWDYVLRRCPGITIEAASAIVQAKRAKTFAPDGPIEQLPHKELEALVAMSKSTVREMREIDRADHAELDKYHALKRKTNAQLELDSLVKAYAMALSFFDRWSKRGVQSMTEARKKINAMEKSQDKLDYLREEIEMRVIGLGFEEYKTAWSSSKDEHVGTVDDLSSQLQLILADERERRASGELPERAVVPQMRRKTYKELGTPTVQAAALAVQVLSIDEGLLLERAKEKRQQLEDTGELDAVGDNQPELPPACDETLVGTLLELRWRYWTKITDEERAAGDKRKKRAVDIWCEGEVVRVANGKTDKESPSCKKLLDAGAVCIKWAADPSREEKETFTWSILTEANWNAEVVLGWRFSGAQLKKRSSAEKHA